MLWKQITGHDNIFDAVPAVLTQLIHIYILGITLGSDISTAKRLFD